MALLSRSPYVDGLKAKVVEVLLTSEPSAIMRYPIYHIKEYRERVSYFNRKYSQDRIEVFGEIVEEDENYITIKQNPEDFHEMQIVCNTDLRAHKDGAYDSVIVRERACIQSLFDAFRELICDLPESFRLTEGNTWNDKPAEEYGMEIEKD